MRIRANNPSPMTLTGTNTYVLDAGDVIEDPTVHRVTGQGLPCGTADEFQGTVGGNHMNVMAILGQTPNDLTHLVGGDPATDTQQDAFIGQSHLLLLFRLTLTGRLR